MKKILSLILFLLFSLNVVNANEDPMAEMASYMLPVYRDLYNCKQSANDYLQVYGLENNKCHFRESFFECHVPMDITQKFAKMNIDWLTNKNRKYERDNSSPEAKFSEYVLNNYCKTLF